MNSGSMDRRRWRAAGVTAGLVAVAVCCNLVRFLTEAPLAHRVAGNIRTFLYIGLFFVWDRSVRRRVTSVQVRRYLGAAARLIIFWLILREFRYRFLVTPALQRGAWYAYYIPIVLIPLFAVFIAMSLDRPEDYRLPGRIYLLYVPALLLIAGILSNDWHQQAFAFPEGTGLGANADYRHGPLYFAAAGWGVFCALLSVAAMIRQCRLPGSRRRLMAPMIPLTLAVAHIFLYLLQTPVVLVAAGDVTIFYSLIFAAFFEACLQTGLIRTNMLYEELFHASDDLAIRVTDRSGRTVYSAGGAGTVPPEQLPEPGGEPTVPDNSRILRTMPVSGGYAVWTEDISEILELREMLEFRQEELRERNALLRCEYEREAEHKRVEEQNRLYDLLQARTQTQLDRIEELIAACAAADSEDGRRRILACIMVLGSFVKRQKDLTLAENLSVPAEPERLENAFAESFRALALLGIRGAGLVLPGCAGAASGTSLSLAYDFFECAAEAVMDRAMAAAGDDRGSGGPFYLNVLVAPVGKGLRISIRTSAALDKEAAALAVRFPDMKTEPDEDGDGSLLLLDLEGGAAAGTAHGGAAESGAAESGPTPGGGGAS